MHLDLERSRYVLRTRAKGLFSALAHDLELEGRFASGEGEGVSGRATVRPAELRVSGVLKGGKCDPHVLSVGDVRDIEHRMRTDVLRGVAEVEIVITALDRVEIVLGGRRAELRGKVRVAGTEVTATGTLSMNGLGLAEVKGPLGAFTVKDDIEVEVRAFLVPG